MEQKNDIFTDAVIVEQSPTRIRIIDSERYADEIRIKVTKEFVQRDIRKHEREKERRIIKQNRAYAQLFCRIIGTIMFLVMLAVMRFSPDEAGGGALMIGVPMSILFLIAPLPKP